VVGVCLAARARAEAEEPRERRRVLLLVDAPGDPFMARIGAEVASLGLNVVAHPPRGPIETSARSEHAVAAIRMLPARNGVEVWMADETSGRSLLRQVIVDETQGGPNHHLIALQTAELLRTSLFPRPPPAAPPAAPPPVIVQSAPPPSSGDSAIASSVGLLYSAGGAGPAWQASLAYQHLWGRRFGLAFALSAPIHRGTMSGPEGSADVGAIVAGAEALARFAAEGGRLALTAGVGAGFAAVLATGHPNQQVSPQLMSNSSTTYTAVATARATLGWKVAGWMTLGLSGLVGATPGRVQIRFAGNDAGTWGLPLVGAALFAAVDWR